MLVPLRSIFFPNREKQADILRTLEQQLKFVRFRQELFEKEAVSLAERLVNGQISLAEWQLQRKEQIKMLHGTCAIAAKGGNKAAMTPHDWGIVGAQCKKQYKFANDFAKAVQEKAEQGKLTLAGVGHRSGQYANSGMATFYQIRTEVAEEEGQTEVRWLTSPVENCAECVELRDMGWMPLAEFEQLGQMPADGSRLCGPGCACFLEYR